MRVLGFDITRAKATTVDDRRGWHSMVREPFAGAWQRNIEIKHEDVLANHAIFSVSTRIACDISKMRIKLVRQDEHGIWSEVKNPAYSPVLRKPNDYQNRIQFVESWVLSKLSRGNTYVLKQRDGRGVVVKLHVLDPARVKPLVTDAGEVFYELSTDNLAGLEGSLVVPAREIIHDRYNCLFHPLVGISPLYAAGLAATQGLRIQESSAVFFQNGSKPGGLLVAPGAISAEEADRLRDYWNNGFSGSNAGKIAIVGNGLKFEGLSVDPVDAELVAQLKWTAEVVCSTFHMPPYKVGIGAMPSYNNVQALNIEYYSSCLQVLIEAIELCLDEGLGTGEMLGTEFDLDNLLRMDSVTQYDVAQKGKGILTLDEQRRKVDAAPVRGGDTIYLQQQDHSLAAIAARDAQLIDQVNNPPAPPEAQAEEEAEPDPTVELAMLALFEKSLREGLHA